MPQIVKSVMLSFVKTLEKPEGYLRRSLYGKCPWEERKHPCLRSGDINASAQLSHKAGYGKMIFLIRVSNTSYYTV